MRNFVKRRMATHLFALAACWAAGAAHAEESVAMVTDLRGEARSAQSPIDILDTLVTGVVLEVAERARITLVYLTSAREYEITGPARLRIEADGPQAETGASAARARDLDIVRETGLDTSGVTQTTIVLRSVGPGRGLRIRGPRGKVLEARPEFRWDPPEGAGAFDVSVRDAAGGELLTSSVGVPHASLPAGITLRPGVEYAWRVRTRQANGRLVTAQARFELATDALRAKVERVRPRAGAPMSERVLYAVWLEREGLSGEAHKAWDVLARERPEARSIRERAGR